MARNYTTAMRSSPEFKQIINEIRARYIINGKTPPSITKITKIIAKKIREKGILQDEFIRF